MNEKGNHPSILLQAIDLKKSFQIGHRYIEVLRGVTLQIYENSFVALCGASGAGKSTLLHLLGGLDRPTSGKILWRGQTLEGLSSEELAMFRNRKIGFVFQAYHLFPELDALENVMLPARIARIPYKEALERAKYLLELVGLKDRLYHRPTELSGGEQQRVAIARALINEPELILADEPTGNLDSYTGTEILDLLEKIHLERHSTLLVATHDIRVANRAAFVMHLKDGIITEVSLKDKEHKPSCKTNIGV